MKENKLSRRKFLGDAAALGALSTVGTAALLNACSSDAKKMTLSLPPLLDQAPDGALIRAGVIGCGGRGTGAAVNFLNAGPNLRITKLADVFQDRIDECRKELIKEKGVEIADEDCHTGFDSYMKVMDSDVDLVILASPPYFRPEHFRAAVEAGKHVFMEKPVAVDPVGVRSVIASAKKAETKDLCVVTGTQRRHQRDYIETFRQVMKGTIGNLVAGNCYWNQSHLWYKERLPEWTDMEYMIRDWVNWLWLSGDHIVEQHIHNIDVINWFTGNYPIRAIGFGSRHRRVTGDLYDNFSVDYIYEGDLHIHSMCRQIDDCANNVSEFIRGEKGYTNCINKIWNNEGELIWEYKYPLDENGQPSGLKISPYDQEHIDLVTAIRTNKPVVEAEATAKTNLAAIMGRVSAYTGKEVTWDEMMQSDLMVTAPPEMVIGPVSIPVIIPIPGAPPK